ncbi:MAG: sulfotransferase [Acidimicrobiales bacterium]|jgi:hypothetical protein|nr:sulfotransferase [Acidimicrobiales bacterium]
MTPPLPTFLVIGAQKSATRWLRLNLLAHPEVYLAPTELEFFDHDDRFERLGPDWYRQQFADWDGAPIIGESTPGYLMWRRRPEVVAERIERTLPDVRLVALLRNPVDRAHSAMVHHITRERLRPDSSLVALARTRPADTDWLGLVAGGWYGASLEPYVRRFGERLLVLLHDDVGTDPAGVYAAVLRHLGADATFVPPELDQVRFSNRAAAPRDVRPLSDADRRELHNYFVDDLRRLEDLLDRDLRCWEPA